MKLLLLPRWVRSGKGKQNGGQFPNGSVACAKT